MLGPTPPHEVVVSLLDTVISLSRARRARERGRAPRDASEWDELFRTSQDHELAWHREALDDDLAALLEREAAPGRGLLDIGTGLGVAAVAAARLGYRVVATDISATALTRARERAGAASSIVWMCDDIARTRLQGHFEVLLDRGCFHLLAPEQIDGYAHAVAGLAAPGGVLLLKTHALGEADSRGTTPYDALRIERLFGTWFSLESDVASSLPGPGVTPHARLFVLRRR